MASNTENLNLLMKNPSTDGADTFNVDTMLNENWRKIDANAGSVAKTLANILKPTTPPIIGLPPSTTPDGMFQALGNTGELHVWRKTTATPAGTTTTYPVSTNPNAYQEWDDAKAAGYVLGSKTETWAISSSASTATARATLASSVSVGDDGTVSLVNPNTNTPVANETNSQYVSVARDYLRGSFLQRSDGTIWYIPSDANVTSTTSCVSKYGAPYNYCFVAEMQPVTGYAAIPDGTTIEYLGKLGDKARVQVVSYVGTGTYGSSNPNSLTFPFKPKMIFLSGGTIPCVCFPGITSIYYVGLNNITVTARMSNTTWYDENNRLSWYTNDSDYQLNYSGRKYTAIAIG